MNKLVPIHFLVPKIPSFDGTMYLTQHLKKFRAHLIMNGGNDAL